MFLIARSLWRRGTMSLINAIYQVILTLTLGFLVIAALRAPTLTEEALDRAALIERVNKLTGQLQEARGEMNSFLELFDAQGLPRHIVISWIGTVVERMRTSERKEVEAITFADAQKRGWIPTSKDLDRFLTVDAVENAHALLKERRTQLTKAMIEGMEKDLNAPTGGLLHSTCNAIRLKSEIFFKQAFKEEYRTLVGHAVSQPYLDCFDFYTPLLHYDITTLKEHHHDALRKYVKRVMSLVPNPDFLPQPEIARKKLNGSIDEGFLSLCAALKRSDTEKEALLKSQPQNGVLEINDLYQPDSGRDKIERFLMRSAQIPADEGKVGPRTKNALKELGDKIFDTDCDSLGRKIVETVKSTGWPDLRRCGVPEIRYDDQSQYRRSKKIDLIVSKITVAAGLPNGAPMNPQLRSLFSSICQRRAQEIFDTELRRVRLAVAKDAELFYQRYVPEIEKGKSPFAQLAIKNPQEARRQMNKEFMKKHNIELSDDSLDEVMNKLSQSSYRRGRERLLYDRWNGIMKRFKAGGRGLKSLEGLTIKERNHFEKYRDAIIDELISDQPEHLRDELRSGTEAKNNARTHFQNAIAMASARFLRDSEYTIKLLVKDLDPVDWKTGKPDKDLAEAVFESLIARMLPEETK